MKLNQITKPSVNKHIDPLPLLIDPAEITDKENNSLTSSLEQQITIIRQTGKWTTDIGEKVLATRVKLPYWPAGRTISVVENDVEVGRYAVAGNEAGSVSHQDVVLYRRAGFYQSAEEFHAGIKPDEDGLFRAVIGEPGEASGAQKTAVARRLQMQRQEV